MGATKALRDAAWNGSDLFVAVGSGGTIQTSPDGVTWTVQTSGTTNDLNKVDYLNGLFIAVGRNGTILTSVNGTSWTSRTMTPAKELKGIAYGEGRYIVVGGDDSSNPVIFTSENGSDWNQVTIDPPFINRSFVTAAYGNGVFVALMQYGQAYRSDDGISWSRASDLSSSSSKYPTDMISAGTQFVAAGGSGEIYLSSDNGESWSIIKSDLVEYLWAVTYGSGKLVAVGENGKIIASADGGNTWFLQPSGLAPNHYFSLYDDAELYGVVTGGDSFVAVGGNGIILQSEDLSISADPDAHDIALFKSRLYEDNILGSGSNYSEGNIVANMNLFTSEEVTETTISWTSSKPEYIAASGTVTRPSFSAGDQVVYLTAVISKGSASDTKTLIVIVKAQPDPDITAVEAAVAALTFDVIKAANDNTSNIVSDLDLITDGGNETSISWQSNKTNYIATDGTVTRPAQGAGDQAVILTATVTKGAVTRTSNFYLTVKAQSSPDAEAVAAAKSALTFSVIKGSNNAEDNIVSNLNLITAGGNGTTVSWQSNNADYIAAGGTVTRPAQGAADVPVTLTATISKGLATATQSFNLTVKAKSVLDVTAITVKTQPADLTYTAGETLDLSGLIVTLTYNDESTLEVGCEDFSFMSITASPVHGTTLSAASHHNRPVTVTCNGQITATSNLTVTAASPGDPGSGGGRGGSGDSTPPANTTTITPEQVNTQLNNNQPFKLQHQGLQINIDPEDLPSPSANGGRIQIQSSVVTDPHALNTFFIQYPEQQGIMRGFNVTFTQQDSSGRSETITQLNGEITLTFQLTPEELSGIDPSTLVVYKQAEDGSITEYSAEFDWATNSLSISTGHLCEFYIMGEKGVPTQRLAGVNRYATAAAISAQGWQTTDNIILASGEDFPDALAGTVLAAVKDAPILLTGKDSITSETLTEIKRLQPKNIYILGGTGVIAQATADLLAKDYTVNRISGGNRYETAVRIGERIVSSGQNTANADEAAIDTAVITTGSDYADALSVASFAGQNVLPILFTEKDDLNTLTSQALSQWGIKKVILIGGAGVVSAKVENFLREEMKLTVTRLSGADRYQTGLEIAKHFAGDQSDSYQFAALATGSNFPDALAGAALAAKLKTPVLLVEKGTVSAGIKDYLWALDLKKLYIFGGKGVITDDIREQIRS